MSQSQKTASIRSAAYRDAKRRARYGGATVSIESRIDSGEFSEAAANALQTQVNKARTRNIRQTANRLPYAFSRPVKREIMDRAKFCDCGNLATDADHIVPFEFAKHITQSVLNSLARYFGRKEIKAMTASDFLKSAVNGQPLCSHCNKARAARFFAAKVKDSRRLIKWLKSEAKIQADMRSNDEMREIKAAFDNEKEAIKRKIRREYFAKNPNGKLNENTINGSNYPALKELENRRAFCLKGGLGYWKKTEFAQEFGKRSK